MTQKTSALNSDQLSRRGFLKASMSMAASPAMLGAAATTVATKAAAQQAEPGLERTLIGYPSRLSCRPGDRVEFKVSAFNNDSFEADLVRIFNADNLSVYKDRFELRPVEADFAGTYDGIAQPLNNGSYVEVLDASALDGLNSFTVGAYVLPTFLPGDFSEEIDPNAAYITSPSIGGTVAEQYMVSRYDAVSQTGWALLLEDDGRISFLVADKGNMTKATTQGAVRQWDFAYVAGMYDAQAGLLRVILQDMPISAGDRFSARRQVGETAFSGPVPQTGLLRVAAADGGPGTGRHNVAAGAFTGRIADPRVISGALWGADIDRMRAEELPGDLAARAMLDLDFSQGIGTLATADLSQNRLEAEVINTPLRAVFGPFSDFKSQDWTKDATPFDAMHFHADDLHDAEWQTSFAYTIPFDLPSGCYAARLTQGDFVEYITFFVSPPKGKRTAKLALHIAEYNMLAYTNMLYAVLQPDAFSGIPANQDDLNFIINNREYVYGFYNTHLDGTSCNYASYLRPMLNLKPGWNAYNFTLDTHLIDFLDKEGIAVDILTDELLHQEGVSLLEGYDCVITGAHPEYVSHAEWDAVVEYQAQGGRMMYLGGNGWFWSVSPHPSAQGAIEYRKNTLWSERVMENGLRGGGFWESDRRLESVFGVNMSGMVFTGCTDFHKTADAENPRASWIFDGCTEGENFGAYGVDNNQPGACGYEFDKADFDLGTPRHALVIGSSNAIPGLIEETQMGTMALNLSHSPAPERETTTRADIVFFEGPNGGAVFSSSSISWCGSLHENDRQNDVASITGNVIRRFLDPTPFPALPDDSVKPVERLPSDWYQELINRDT